MSEISWHPNKITIKDGDRIKLQGVFSIGWSTDIIYLNFRCYGYGIQQCITRSLLQESKNYIKELSSNEIHALVNQFNKDTNFTYKSSIDELEIELYKITKDYLNE